MQWAAANVPVTSVIEAVHAWTIEPKPAGLSADQHEAAQKARARLVLDQTLSQAAQAGPVEPPVRAHLAQGDPRSVLHRQKCPSISETSDHFCISCILFCYFNRKFIGLR